MMLSALTNEGRKTVRDNPERIQLVNKAIEKWGAKVIAQYALLGPYDFLTILQAEDAKAILKVSAEMGARGTVKIQSFPAFPIEEFIKDITE
jgi:uncharacterized protein with GYD domain